MKQEVTALVQPSSASKPEVEALKPKGIRVVAVDLKGKHAEIVHALQGIDVLISAITFSATYDQIALVDAAKEAGVKRFM